MRPVVRNSWRARTALCDGRQRMLQVASVRHVCRVCFATLRQWGHLTRLAALRTLEADLTVQLCRRHGPTARGPCRCATEGGAPPAVGYSKGGVTVVRSVTEKPFRGAD